MTKLEELKKELTDTRSHNALCDIDNEWDSGSITLDVVIQLLDYIEELEERLNGKQDRQEVYTLGNIKYIEPK